MRLGRSRSRGAATSGRRPGSFGVKLLTMVIKLSNQIAADGSRQFLLLPESCAWSVLRSHLGALDGVALGEYLTDGVVEAWIDFTYKGYRFTINNQFGEYWFFSDDPICPVTLLTEIAQHCQTLRCT